MPGRGCITLPSVSRPINADVPPVTEPARPPRRRRGVPGALKAIAGLVALALAFLLAAVLWGSSGEDGGGETAPVPVGGGARSPAETPATQAPVDSLYPALATGNTTRVAGAEPAADAAAVALAVYPSQAPAQRPPAVALVGEDWREGIAAAVLMAEPVGAPLLLSGAGEVPEATLRALEALDPRGSGATGGAEAFAIGDVAVPDGLDASRVARRGPVATAAALAALRERLSGEPPRHFLVAPSRSPAFAMPAAAWAARSGDPVLFAGESRLPPPTAATLRRHEGVPVYVLGPSSAISSEVVREIAAAGNPVSRVSGETPVENAIALARYDDGAFGWNVNDPGHGFVLARSGSPLDAAAAAPLSASGKWGPLLLTDSADRVPPALRGYLLDVKPGYTTDPTRAFYNHVWVIGDSEAIDVTQQAEIDALAELARVGGNP